MQNELAIMVSNNKRVDYTIASKTRSLQYGFININPLRLVADNSKLKGISIFDMPAVKTCINCDDCKAKCYAMKSQRMYPDTAMLRETNLQLFLNSSELLFKLICNQLDSGNIKVVRLHSSGDFFSQEYIDFWYSIIVLYKDIKFYTYTKADTFFNFERIESLSNFNLIRSYIGYKINFGSIEYCNKLHKEYNAFICPATTTKGVKCGKDCSYCVTNKNVCFIEH